MKVTVLGSQGAIPKVGLFSTSLILNVCNSYVLIDCCEGVQHQLRKNKIKLSKIEIILISHAHGDHYFGLIGLISTLSLLKRDKKLHRKIVKQVKEKAESNNQTSFGIYSTNYQEDCGYVLSFSSEIQEEERYLEGDRAPGVDHFVKTGGLEEKRLR